MRFMIALYLASKSSLDQDVVKVVQVVMDG
jgi:hypothetical protein